MKPLYWIIIIVIILVAGVWVLSRNQNVSPKESDMASTTSNGTGVTKARQETKEESEVSSSERAISVTDGEKHSVPLDEILAGGPPKDGIPSIDEPKFIKTSEANNWLGDDSPGLGIEINGIARFYPYQILVWHEIVNDNIAGDPVLVTYCPLCGTGIAFEGRVRGIAQEFGVSGRLWQSNLLMYNRAKNESDESLWSQILGEAVVGVNTGEKLKIVPSVNSLYKDWKASHPNTVVLSKDTGALRRYGDDPYEGYYSNTEVGFGAEFDDDRLHPKDFVLGINVNGKFKAYLDSALPVGITTDEFAGETITVSKKSSGGVEFQISGQEAKLPHIGSFWFSWLAVHPNTLLYK